MALYGTMALGMTQEAWARRAASLGRGGGGDEESTPEPHLPSQEELYVVCVERVVEGETERHWHWLCPRCDAEEKNKQKTF